MENKSTGKTFYDYAHDNPIKVGLIFFAILFAIIYFRVPIKYEGMEINSSEKKEIPTPIVNQQNIKEIHETKIIPNQAKENHNTPNIINNGINNGVMGNDNQITVVNEKPIELTDTVKADILGQVFKCQTKLPIEKRNCIIIEATNKRALEYGNLIQNFLNSRGYNIPNVTFIMENISLNENRIYVENDCVYIAINNI